LDFSTSFDRLTAHERLLGDVLGVGAAPQHPERHREDQALVTVHERPERLDVSRHAAGDEAALFLVARGRGAGGR
jgi:hypothetical protein